MVLASAPAPAPAHGTSSNVIVIDEDDDDVTHLFQTLAPQAADPSQAQAAQLMAHSLFVSNHAAAANSDEATEEHEATEDI